MSFIQKNVLPLFLLILTISIGSCKKKEPILKVDPAYGKYIEGYTTGIISKNGSIKIQLTANASTTHTLGEAADQSLFEFSPAVKGKAVWIDARTIEFIPAEPLKPAQLYKVQFRLGKVTETTDKYKIFTFNFQTISPAFQVTSYGLRSTGEKDRMYLKGKLETSDTEDDKAVEKLLKAASGNQSLQITWQHTPNSSDHYFTIENIQRSQKEQKLHLAWNGKPLNSKSKGEKEISIPAIGDFKVMEVMALNEGGQYASVQFSDPILSNQDLTGLITIENQEDIAYTIDGSEVKIYTGNELEGNYTIHINTGIQSTFGKRLEKGFTANVFFENRLPQVKIAGRGNILPREGKLTLPFESVNLKAVDISIIKIYENNVPQFLQINGLNGDYDLRRVGKPVVQKTIRLDEDPNLNLKERQNFSLDIDQLLKAEPGAIYRVTIGFRPQYSLYSCDSTSELNNTEANDYYSQNIDEDDQFWQSYDNYYPFGYDWQNRDNPCYPSYYNKDKWASRNILASSLGLTIKKGGQNNLTVFVNDLLTTNPLEEVEIRALDYQNQIIEKGRSNANGILKLNLKRTPYLLIAQKKDDITYIKLDDAGSLPLSRFDITGAEIQNGIKGFIFGERGVWRPGDSLYINFIIDNKEAGLPDDHPIEFELITPRGLLYQRMVQTNADGGFNVFKTATNADAPTGNWLVKIKAGGATFEKRMRIETIMPNRLKIDLDFGRDTILGKGMKNSGDLTVEWLFGAPAKNISVKVDATFIVSKTPFPQWKGFVFTNPAAEFSATARTVFDGKVDENGKTAISPKFENIYDAPGMLSAALFIKAFEPGGAFSVKNLKLPYSPFNSYVGLKLPQGDQNFGFLATGKTHTAEIMRVNNQGKIINENQNVEVKLYRIQWRWWWDESSNNLENFTQDKYNKLIKSETVTLNNGKAKWNFSVGQQDWGRYLLQVIDKESGHTTGQIMYIDEPGWQNRDNTDDPTAASMLAFSADKETYAPGEEITLTIPSHEGGRALISVETGSSVLKTMWANTTKEHTKVKIKVEPQMAPNVYMYVSLLQPHSQTANDLPIRMYGVIPIKVEDKQTILRPVIEIPASIRPQQKTKFTVTEQQGRELFYSVAIVDEGLLALTNFHTPDPHSHFYSRQALGVKTWDLYDFVIGARTNKMDRILTIGGDEAGGPLAPPKEANRFKPVVKYLGPFYLKKGARNMHDFTLPEYIGNVRVMVVAARNGSYGNAEKNVQVKKPLMLLGTAPRVLSPGDLVQIPVSVFAMENNMKQVTVQLQSNKLITIEGAGTRTVNFSSPGEQVIYFTARVKSEEGIASLRMTATSGNERAESNIELNVKNPNENITRIYSKNVEGKQQWTETVQAIGNAEEAESVIEISAIPALNLEKRLDFLINYPHGCVEQIVSGAFPQLVLHQLTKLSDEKKALAQRNIRSVINSLQNYQLSSGGFSYWPGGNEADDWGSSYAGHFLLEAQKRGYTVSGEMLQKWRQYQSGKAGRWAPSTTNFFGGDLLQAYRLYTLALAKAADLGAMNRLKEFKYLSPQAKWRLAAAYALAGQNGTALQMISGLPTNFNKNYQGGITYGSDLRDQAMVLETLTLLGRKAEAAALVNSIAAQLSKDQWYSTQTTAYSLLAISEYTGKNSGVLLDATVTAGAKTTQVQSNEYIAQIPVDVSKGTAKVIVKNNGNSVLYVRIISKGKPLTDDAMPALNSTLLHMQVEYLNYNLQPLNEASLKQGTDFIAKVTVKNTGSRGTYENLALTQIFPSGWEIINTRMQAGAPAFPSSRFDYQDIRDDRVNTYFSLKQNETRTFYVQLNAAYKGEFFKAGAYGYEMYNEEISASERSRKVVVTD